MVGDVAIDLGTYSVKSLSVTKKGGLYQVDDANEEILNYGEGKSIKEKDAIANALQLIFSNDSKLKKIDPYIAVPLSEVIIREVELDNGIDSDYQIEKNIQVKLLDALPFTIEQIYFDFVKKPGTEKDFTVAAIRRDYVNDYTNIINSCLEKNHEVSSVDIDAYAYGRLVGSLYDSVIAQDGVVVLVDVGTKNTRFYFYGAGGFLFSRVQQIGGHQVTENLMDVFNLLEDEAEKDKLAGNFSQDTVEHAIVPFVRSFVEQLLLVIDLYESSKKTDATVSKIVLCGGGACLEGLVDALGRDVEFPVEHLDITPILRSGSKGIEVDHHFSAKYALAVAMLSEGK